MKDSFCLGKRVIFGKKRPMRDGCACRVVKMENLKDDNLDALFLVMSYDDAGDQFHLFKGFNPDEKFDLNPSRYTDRCLSNHHHLKAKEIIYAKTCENVHCPNTGYWVRY
ncbi:hypothetical protein HJC23_010378 [Cyclotella cryptica]|uniref:Uncharacterized protein n=1 Tax=Cyclotella cryptica TaxID=29204 RepID=A0ABD3QGY5_9STRA